MLMACSSVRVTLPYCTPPLGTARIIREQALGSLRKTLGEVCDIVGSEARARQCIERAHGDRARLWNVLDKELQRDDIEDPAPSGSCLVCCEELAQPTLFDCGHPVCFACTTNMLLAKHKDAVYALPCPFSVQGCKGQISFLSCASLVPEHMYMRAAVSARDGFACAASSPDAAREWRCYLPVVENAMLRAVGMYECPSPACTKNDILLFIPPGKTQAAEDTECESCGLHICTTCTRTAGKVVAFHEPFPCAQRVAFEDQLSAIQAGMRRANEIEQAAVQRANDIERAAARERERGVRRWVETRSGWSGRHCPKIDEHVFELLGKGERTVSYAEIFDAAATATKAAGEREKQMPRPIDGAQGINGDQAAGHGTSNGAGQNAELNTSRKKRREHSPTAERALELSNYETLHGLPSGKASVDQAAKACAGMSGSAAWVPGGDKKRSSECLDENPVDPQAGASSGAAGGAAASGAASLSAASLSAEGDAAMHDSKGTDHRQEEEEEEEQMAAGLLAWRDQQEIEGPESWRDEAADEGDRRGIAARTHQVEAPHVGTATGENMALRSALRMDEEEEGQATSAVDQAPSRELPAQILNSTLYSDSMQYAASEFVADAAWCASFVARHSLSIGIPTLEALHQIVAPHARNSKYAEAARVTLQDIQAGTYREPGPAPELTDEELVHKTSKPCPTGCGSQIEKNLGCNHMTCSRCRHEFCWRCLQPYKHPASAGTCAGAPDVASFHARMQELIRTVVENYDESLEVRPVSVLQQDIATVVAFAVRTYAGSSSTTQLNGKPGQGAEEMHKAVLRLEALSFATRHPQPTERWTERLHLRMMQSRMRMRMLMIERARELAYAGMDTEDRDVRALERREREMLMMDMEMDMAMDFQEMGEMEIAMMERMEMEIAMRERTRVERTRAEQEGVAMRKQVITHSLSATISIATADELAQRIDHVQAKYVEYEALVAETRQLAALKDALHEVWPHWSLVDFRERTLVLSVLANQVAALNWKTNSKLCELALLLGHMGQDPAESSVKVEWNVPSLEERFESAGSQTENGSESLAAIFSGVKRWCKDSILDLLAPWEKITTEPGISEKARQVLPLVLMQQRLDYAFVLGRANERACVIHENLNRMQTE